LINAGFHSGGISNISAQFTAGNHLVHLINPLAKKIIYPRVQSSDPVYDVLELRLRSAVNIPLAFTYGKKPPVILVPGTGSTGFLTYSGNYLKLLSNVDYADPIWLNIPDFLLNDAQTNAVW
jgi:hypothetical protein